MSIRTLWDGITDVCKKTDRVLWQVPPKIETRKNGYIYARCSKTILHARTEEEAQAIAEKLHAFLNHPDNTLKNRDGTEKPYPLKITIIKADDITLSLTTAYKSRKITAKDARELIEENYEGYELERLLKRLRNVKKVKMLRGSGQAYRLNFYNKDTGKREQISVCDVVIVISDTDNLTIRPAQPRKNRTDKTDLATGIHCEWKDFDTIKHAYLFF